MEIQWFVLYAPNCALDPLGYHCVTCKRGVDITTRHNTLRNVVYSIFQRAGLSAHLEVGCGYGDKTIPGHDQQTSLLPIGIVGPQLPLTLLLHPSLIQSICWKQACTRVFQQRQQSTENIQRIQKMIPSVLALLAAKSYGAWGQEALRAFSQVATQLAIRGIPQSTR